MYSNLPMRRQCDVLVIGGGSAGQMAALYARRAGLSVIMADKAGIYRSGCGGAGNDHFLAVLESGPAWDTPEVFLKWYNKVTQGLVDVRIAERSFITHIKGLIAELEELGCPMRLGPDNTFIRTKSFQQPGEYFINGDGRNLKPRMTEKLKKAGVELLPFFCATDLLTRDGRCVGAAGFSLRPADEESGWLAVQARQTVLATGNAGRMYPSPSGLPFNLWHSPFNTGTAQALAFRAGAAVSNMEFVNCTLTPRNFAASGLNAIVGMGGHIVNAKGERFLFNYHEKGEQGPRWVMPWGVYWESVNGRGPCYFDMRHLSEESIKMLEEHLLPVDKNTFNDWLEQAGLNIRHDLIEAQISEGQHPAFLGSVSGVYVDECFKTTLPGLMSAGACCPSIGSLTGSMCTGIAAGLDAAESVKSEAGEAPALPPDAELQELREERLAPLRVRDGLESRRFEDLLRQIMQNYVSIGRTEMGLNEAARRLDNIAPLLGVLKAANSHELMRCNEARELYEVARLIVRGALERKESRFGLSHFRGDYPEPRQEFHKSILLTTKGGGIAVNFRPSSAI